MRSLISFFNKSPKKDTHNLLNQSGRSMVEILGVLALIGILSAGGIMGYQYAINKYRANDTLHEVTRRALVLYQQQDSGQPLSQTEFGATTLQGYTINYGVMPADNSIYISLSSVPQGVCRSLVTSNYPHMMYVNEILNGGDPDLCRENNEIQIVFNTEAPCQEGDSCACGGICVNGKCENTCSKGSACTLNADGVSDMCCPYDHIAGGLCCARIDENNNCCDESNRCCPKDKPIMDKNGLCRSCNESLIFVTTPQECNKCASHEALAGISDIYCRKKNQCANGSFYTAGRCVSCNSPDNHYILTPEDCLVCPNRVVKGSVCAIGCPENTTLQNGQCVCAPGFWSSYGGGCISCSTDGEVWNGDSCAACPNKVHSGLACKNECHASAIQQGSKCVCPDNKFMGDNGICYECSEPRDIRIYTLTTACGKCDGQNGRTKRRLKHNGAYPFCVLESPTL